ncbi:TPA: gp436 family protein [Citrobacter amalonaticus]
MGIYVTREDLLANDASLVWNMAVDKATQQLDDVKIDAAIQDTDAEINSILSRRYQMPLALPDIPRPLRRAAISIAIYWLSERDNQITELIQKRYDDAVRTLKEMASGARDLGLPQDAQPAETGSGSVLTVGENPRLFTRNNLKGVL